MSDGKASAGELVLVTGGAGYIGCVLVPKLLQEGYRVRVFDKLLYGSDGLADVRGQIELIEGDIRSFPAGIFDDVTGVVNLAALSAEPAAEYLPEVNHAINTWAAIGVARAAKEAGVRRFVQASSGSIYDVGAGNAALDILHNEDFPVAPFRVYSITKREAEKAIIPMADQNFCPVMLRKGSVYGYSPRMRLDLVVNAFVCGAMRNGVLTLHNGGEMWRPLLDIHDAAAAYVLALQAPAEKVSGQIFNILYDNYRISEVALRVRHTLAKFGIQCDLQPDYKPQNLRSCQASGKKVFDQLGFKPQVSIESAVEDLVEKIQGGVLRDTGNPKFHNIRWIDFLEETKTIFGYTDSVFDLPGDQLKELRSASLVQGPQ